MMNENDLEFYMAFSKVLGAHISHFETLNVDIHYQMMRVFLELQRLINLMKGGNMAKKTAKATKKATKKTTRKPTEKTNKKATAKAA